MAPNKYLTPRLIEDKHSLLAKSAAQIFSLNLGQSSLLSSLLITGFGIFLSQLFIYTRSRSCFFFHKADLPRLIIDNPPSYLLNLGFIAISSTLYFKILSEIEFSQLNIFYQDMLHHEQTNLYLNGSYRYALNQLFFLNF